MASRNDNGRSSVYKGKDGSWHGRVTVGRKPDGSPDRRHVRASTKAEATRKVRALEKSREEHAVPALDVSWSEGAFPWEMGHRKQQSASTNAVVL